MDLQRVIEVLEEMKADYVDSIIGGWEETDDYTIAVTEAIGLLRGGKLRRAQAPAPAPAPVKEGE